MSNPNPFQPSAAQGNYPQQGQLQQQQTADQRSEFINYRFTPEELRVITECEIESFYYRSLPLSLGLGTATLMGVKNGYLKASPKFGPWPKVIAIGLFGYIAGRLSYTKKCQEKMMALPNSRFAEMLRRNLNRKSGSSNWDLGSPEAGAALSLAPFQAATDSIFSDQYNQPDALNLDTNRPNYSGLDDTYHPTMEGNNDLNEDLEIPTRKTTVTYDELRQKNRADYAKNHYQQPASVPYYQDRQSVQPSHSSPPTNLSGPLNPPAGSYNPTGPPDNDRRRAYSKIRGEDDAGVSDRGQGVPKNRYGDVWD